MSDGNVDKKDHKAAEVKRIFEGACRTYPEAPPVSVAQLQEWVSAPSTAAVVVDVRDAAEQEVSIIPGAKSTQQFNEVKEEVKNLPVVCYCTLGYRSGQYAQQLKKEGFDARNLEGGILGWTQAGGKLVKPGNEEASATQVHVWNKKFAGLAADGLDTIYYGGAGTIGSLLKSLWPWK